jgi:hypothetical protein
MVGPLNCGLSEQLGHPQPFLGILMGCNSSFRIIWPHGAAFPIFSDHEYEYDVLYIFLIVEFG